MYLQFYFTRRIGYYVLYVYNKQVHYFKHAFDRFSIPDALIKTCVKVSRYSMLLI